MKTRNRIIAPHTDANNDGKCDVCEYGQIEVSNRA